jgi:NhaA family Na+:H+ antiporter
VIAIFYTRQISWWGLGIAAAFLAAIALANRLRVRQPVVYVALALGVWAGVLASGVHATIAGVLVALLVPVRSRISPREFLDLTDDRLTRLRAADLTTASIIEDRWQLDAISDLRRVASDMRPPGLALEETLHPFVAFAILPLFAFFNAGVAVSGNILDALRHPVGLGVVLGLVVGKQVGVTLFTWLAVTLARAERPEGVSWSQIYGSACLAGIGFTMSMFVDQLAFTDPANVDRAKVGILIASVVAAGWGGVVLALRLPRQKTQPTVTVPPKS